MTYSLKASRGTIAVGLLALVGCAPRQQGSSEQEGRSAPQALADGQSIASIALANLGHDACNPAYDSSCTGNGGLPEYWCADFARWVWQAAGVTDLGGLSAAAGSFYVYGQQHGTLSNTPHLGDAVVFNSNGGGYADHVAIVTQVNGDGTIETVSGDWGGQSGYGQAHFASTSHVVLNAPAFPGSVGAVPPTMGMTISGFISPVGLASGPPTLALSPQPSGCGAIKPGEGLARETDVKSCSGAFMLKLQSDGNLVLYQNGVGPIWSTHTDGTNGYGLLMQSDGNLVLYSPYGNPLWASGTDGQSGASLAIQDDGNVVLYRGGTPIWATNTAVSTPPPPPPPPPPPNPPSGCGAVGSGQSLGVNASVQSCDGRFNFIMQSDGNLVLYEGSTPLWSSNTNGTDASEAIMQTDGNLVLYNASGTPRWASGTSSAGASLAIQNDGNVVIYQGGSPIWATDTCCH